MDVDGVLALRAPAPARYLEYTVVASTGSSHRVWLNSDHGRWLTSLAVHFDVVWATGWEQDAPRLLGGLLGIPPFPVLEFTDRPRYDRSFSKVPDVRKLVMDRPVAWVDDDLEPEAAIWAADRAAPTLLVQPSTRTGLLMKHVNELIAFAAEQGRNRHPDRGHQSLEHTEKLK